MFTISLLLALQAAAPPAPIDLVSWFSANDYPADPFGKYPEGKVGYSIEVDATGRPKACIIQDSSGHEALDQATCRIVLARGRFEPARDAVGAAVPGTYQGHTVWTHPNTPSQSYQATILDFSGDRRHPLCTMKAEGSLSVGALSCTAILHQKDWVKRLGKTYSQVAFLVATASNNARLYRGEANWGERLSHVASDQYYRAGEQFPFACISTAAEGWDAGRDPCSGFPGAHSLEKAEGTEMWKSQSATSIFGIHR